MPTGDVAGVSLQSDFIQFCSPCYNCVDPPQAFKRIFRIHDRDMDGLLSDSELNSFQRKCVRTDIIIVTNSDNIID